MSAEQLVQWTTNAAFLAVFALVGLRAIRRPTRLAVDSALLFGALGVVILQGLVLTVLGVGTIPLLQAAAVGIVGALPYLTLRLARNFAPVSPQVLWASLAAAAALAAVGLASATLPAWIVLFLAVEFVALEGYAGWVFVRAARRAVGATRARLYAAALGSLFLVLAIVVAGLRVALPVLGAITGQAFALASAVAYLHAFSPPAFVRRGWREPHLRAFLAAATRASARPDTGDAIAELEAAIAAAMGATEVTLRRSTDGALDLGDLGDETQALAASARAARRPILVDRQLTTVLVAPIAGADLLGVVVVRLEGSPGFTDESLALLELLAEHAAIVLESARLRDEASAASRAKSEFLANMSHELRTPLNAILGFSSLMREHASLAADKRERYLANITDAGEHLLALINDVLDLSTVEAGRILLRPDRTTTAALAQPVVASVARDAESVGVTLSVDVRGANVVRVDAQRIRQVLLNLLSNSVKFTPQGGRVRLLVAVEGADLVAEVADTGIGIPVDRQDRLFAAFERVNEDRSEAAGTGLGLALTKRLVELHGGTLAFESAAGVGTTFRIRIPGVVVEDAGAERILVVEDEERDAQLIRALAAELGLRCEIVATVAGALEAVARDTPLAVVLDLRLPDGRGEQVLAAIRGAARTRSLPVGIVTVEDDAPAARALGASLILTKPIDVYALSAWLGGLRQLRVSRAS